MLPLKDELEILVARMDGSGIRIDEAVREFKKRFVIQVLTRNLGNQSKAARDLGWHRNTAHRNMEQLGINPDEYKRKGVISERALPVSYPQVVGAKTSA